MTHATRSGTEAYVLSYEVLHALSNRMLKQTCYGKFCCTHYCKFQITAMYGHCTPSQSLQHMACNSVKMGNTWKDDPS